MPSFTDAAAPPGLVWGWAPITCLASSSVVTVPGHYSPVPVPEFSFAFLIRITGRQATS
jgi:hypothetical protein